MRFLSLRTVLACVAVPLGLLLCSAPASADSLLYVKGGYVYVANPDGSQARAVTPQSSSWAWPSESNNGNIAVAGGAAGTNGTIETSGSSNVYLFDQQGHSLLSSPVETPGSVSGPTAPTYVNHFRISPDGSTVAYNYLNYIGAASGVATFTSPMSPAGNSNWSDFFDDFIDPEWVDASANFGSGFANSIGLTHSSTNFGYDYGAFPVSNPSGNATYSGDASIPDGWAFDAGWSHDATKLALVLDNAPDVGGTASEAKIQLETLSSTGSTDGCVITLDPSKYAGNQTSLTFSSDGRTIAWGQTDGIYEADVSNPNSCGAPHLVVPGGAMPYLGAAPLSPPTCGSCNNGGAPNTKLTGAKINRHKRSATFKFSGGTSFKCKLDRGKWSSCHSPKTYKRLKRGKHTFEVEAVDGGGRTDPTPAKKKFKI
jgi:hypothetical protein